MKVIRETIVAGKTIIQSYRASTRIKTAKGEKRATKSNPTPESVRKINLKNAVKNLTAILNANFTEADYHLTLTYAGEEPSKEEAKNTLKNFIRRMSYYCKKHELDWRWVAVTEYENHRIHHHIVCSGVDPQVINKNWTGGYVNYKSLDSNGNYYRLAEYLVKETEKTFRDADSVSKKRYSHSRSIVIPDIKKEIVSERMLEKDPVALKGYYIDQDTVNRYEHAILGVECLEYIQVSLDASPRLRRWNKGKKAKREQHYREHWGEQLEIEF